MIKFVIFVVQCVLVYSFDRIVSMYGVNYTYKGGDEFSNDIDNSTNPSPSLWEYDLGYIANNEAQWYTNTRSNSYVNVSSGELVLVARHDPENAQPPKFMYTSARLTTKNTLCVRSGSLTEARIFVPGGRGAWPAFWLLGHGEWPYTGEIDIMESVGYIPNTVWSAVHTELFNGMKGNNPSQHTVFPTLNSQYHTFRVFWNNTGLEYYVDDILTFTLPPLGTNKSAWPFVDDKCLYIIFNIAIGGNWGGKEGIDDSIFPVTMKVDYVRVYEAPRGGDEGKGSNNGPWLVVPWYASMAMGVVGLLLVTSAVVYVKRWRKRDAEAKKQRSVLLTSKDPSYGG
eukprot:PhF_6_TR31185/c0_g1_i2/m.45729